MKHLQRGILVALEGIDGSGKTTLARLLSASLSAAGSQVLLTKEPGATALGAGIRELINHAEFVIAPRAELFLFAADRAQHIAHVVHPALAEKKIVISDRMADSTRAYQGFGRGMDMQMIEAVIDYAMSGIKPDVTIYCAIDVDTVMKRIVSRGQRLTRFEAEERSFQERVFQGFETLFAPRTDVIRLDMKLPIHEVAQQALQMLVQRINEIKDT